MGAPWTPPVQQGFDNDNAMRLSFDSLSKFIKTKYAGLDTAQTFTGANTFTGTSTFQGAMVLDGTTTGTGTVTLSNTLNTVGGFQRAGSPAKALITSGYQAFAGPTYTLTATRTTLTGQSITLSLLAGDTVFLSGQWDFSTTTAGCVAVGEFWNTSATVFGPLAVFVGQAVSSRATVPSSVAVQISATGSYTFVQAARFSTTGGGTCGPTQTGFSWMVYR